MVVSVAIAVATVIIVRTSSVVLMLVTRDKLSITREIG